MTEPDDRRSGGDDWNRRVGTLGSAIRAQRQLAHMSLRKLSNLAQVSNPYLSQIERGLHEPSVRVLRSIARALSVSAEDLLQQAGMIDARFESRTETRPTDSRNSEDPGPGEEAEGRGPAGATNRAVAVDTETAIANDPHLTPEQREALLTVYRSYRSRS